MSALRFMAASKVRVSPIVRASLKRNTRIFPSVITTLPSRSIVTDSVPPFQQQQQQQQQQSSTNQDPRKQILDATLPFVVQYGWSMESLIQGAKSLGYPSVAHGVFPGGEAGLIDAYLSDSRETFARLVKEKMTSGELEGLSMNERVECLTALRLDMNKPLIHKWPEALAIMARPSNVSMSLKHLAEIADDIWYYSGDKSPDMNWYTRRGSLAAIYSATDLFMTKDVSSNYTETDKFLKRRLGEAAWLGSSARQLGTMLTFGAKSMMSALSNRGGRF